MGKYLGPTCKLCRREGVSLCGKAKCAVKRRNFPPGVHGNKGKPRLSGYGVQLREKQKAKRLYNILEKQFRNYFEKAINQKGDTSESLVKLLETRLDNVIYRLGLATTRRQARQMVNHGFFLINGKKVNIPSYQIKIGDVITIKQNKTEKKIFESIKASKEKVEMPSWLDFDAKAQEGKVLTMPSGDELKQIFDPKLIVEFYSR